MSNGNETVIVSQQGKGEGKGLTDGIHKMFRKN